MAASSPASSGSCLIADDCAAFDRGRPRYAAGFRRRRGAGLLAALLADALATGAEVSPAVTHVVGPHSLRSQADGHHYSC
jgi:hypothetical protein